MGKESAARIELGRLGKGLIFLILYNANLQDRAVLVMWSVKFSLSSITSPRFLAVFEGVMFDEPNWNHKQFCLI